MIGDPCYWVGKELETNDDWKKFCEEHFDYEDGSKTKNQIDYKAGHAGKGVVFSTTYGDGYYPVYVVNDPERKAPRFAIVVMDDTLIEDILK